MAVHPRVAVYGVLGSFKTTPGFLTARCRATHRGSATGLGTRHPPLFFNLFLENPEVLGKLRLLWVRSGDRRHENYNYRVSVFRSSVIEMIALKAPLYGIEVKYVDPKGTTSSREHDDVMRKYRLDRHTTSAYLIALKGLKQP